MDLARQPGETQPTMSSRTTVRQSQSSSSSSAAGEGRKPVSGAGYAQGLVRAAVVVLLPLHIDRSLRLLGGGERPGVVEEGRHLRHHRASTAW